jgi:Mitochondrial branched-chain alpha-ketoacid dehydrogenase kinase
MTPHHDTTATTKSQKKNPPKNNERQTQWRGEETFESKTIHIACLNNHDLYIPTTMIRCVASPILCHVQRCGREATRTRGIRSVAAAAAASAAATSGSCDSLAPEIPTRTNFLGNQRSQQQQQQQHVRSFTTTSSNHLVITDQERELIEKQAKEPQTSVSLQALMRTGRGEFLDKTFGQETLQREQADARKTQLVLIQVAGFLRRELPIRLAHRIHDLEGVPLLADMESVKIVRDQYIKSCLELCAFDNKIETAEQEEAFAKVVETIYERHSKVLVQMARGAYEFRQAVRLQSKNNATEAFELQAETHDFLDRFYICRIGIRVLIGQVRSGETRNWATAAEQQLLTNTSSPHFFSFSIQNNITTLVSRHASTTSGTLYWNHLLQNVTVRNCQARH